MAKRIFMTGVPGNSQEITNKKVILYGTGEAFFKLIDEIRFRDAAYIVDSDPAKEGMELDLYGKKYTVHSPSVLRGLDYSEYCVIIASTKYADEIYREISGYVPDSCICTDRKKIVCRYDTLRELLTDDSLTKAALARTGWDRDPAALERHFSDAYRCVHSDRCPEYFFTVRSGYINLLFGYKADQGEYVFRQPPVPGRGYQTIVPFFESGKKIRREFRKRTRIGNELMVYENADGIRIDRYAEPFYYQETVRQETIDSVLLLLKSLHSSSGEIGLSADYPAVHYRFFSDLFGKSLPGQIKIKNEIDRHAEALLRRYAQFPAQRCLCHGDSNYTNLVRYEGRLFYVDWDSMAMGDPFFDVCEFLFDIRMRSYTRGKLSYDEAAEQLYGALEHDLGVYLGRSCREAEYRRAHLITELMELGCLLRDWAAAGNVRLSQYQSILSRKANDEK